MDTALRRGGSTRRHRRQADHAAAPLRRRRRPQPVRGARRQHDLAPAQRRLPRRAGGGAGAASATLPRRVAPSAVDTPTLLAIDQGTTGTTCLLLGIDGTVQGRAYREVPVAYPRPGWVEQDAEALWESVAAACAELLDSAAAPAAVGITNQRETVVVFERDT